MATVSTPESDAYRFDLLRNPAGAPLIAPGRAASSRPGGDQAGEYFLSHELPGQRRRGRIWAAGPYSVGRPKVYLAGEGVRPRRGSPGRARAAVQGRHALAQKKAADPRGLRGLAPHLPRASRTQGGEQREIALQASR